MWSSAWRLILGALVVGVLGHGSGESPDERYKESMVSELSLPELAKIKQISEIGSDWVVQDSVEFFEGRLVLTPKPQISSNEQQLTTLGSIWSKPKKGLQEVETQVTLRSIGSFGPTGAGFSVFFTSGNEDDKQYNKNNFGGPSRFTGLHITLDASHPRYGAVFRAYLNDGTRDVDLDKDLLGAYRYQYQASNVPVTLKIGISHGWLKVTVDNKLLFETNKVNLDEVVSNLRVGVAASSPKDVKKYEQFELLRLKSYNQVSPELRADCKESLVAKHIQSSYSGGNQFRSQEEVLRLQLEQEMQQSAAQAQSQQVTDSSATEGMLSDMLAKLGQMEATLGQSAKAPAVDSTLQTNLQKQIFLLTRNMERLTDNINNVLRHSEEANRKGEILERKYDNLQVLLERQAELLRNAEVSSRAISTTFQQQIDKLNSAIDVKVSGIHDDYMRKLDSQSPQFEAKLNSISSFIKLVFLPLAALIVVLVLMVTRLRNDIKHTKVL